MKKLFLNAFMILFLMSFTNKLKTERDKKDVLSPKCWDFADKELAKLAHLPIDYENAHNIWSYYYEFCEYFSN